MMSNPELINNDNGLDAIKDLSRKDKILYFLKKRFSEVSGQDLIELTGIDKDNISKIFKVLENEGLISRRYDQVGRARLVFITLTGSQSKLTVSLNKGDGQSAVSRSETTDSPSKITDRPIKKQPRVSVVKSKKPELILDRTTDSPSKSTVSRDRKNEPSRTDSQIIFRQDPRLLLTRINLIKFVKQCERTKVYEMRFHFFDNTASEIKKLVDKLKKRKILVQNKNGWISYNPKKKKKPSEKEGL